MKSFITRERKCEHQAQVDKVLSLYRQAEMFSETGLPYHEVCPICPRQVYLHLQSKVHLDRENEVDGLQDNVNLPCEEDTTGCFFSFNLSGKI